MKRLLLILLLASFGFSAKAQGFTQAAGVRLGWTPGFEYRIFSNDNNAYRVLLGTRDRGVQLHAIKEFHEYDIFDFSEQLVLFYGVGLHAGYERWNAYHYNDNVHWRESRTSMIAGLDAVIGVEYVFYEAPVSIGFEAKPYFDLFGRETFDLQLFDFAFTVKYLF